MSFMPAICAERGREEERKGGRKRGRGGGRMNGQVSECAGKYVINAPARVYE